VLAPNRRINLEFEQFNFGFEESVKNMTPAHHVFDEMCTSFLILNF